MNKILNKIAVALVLISIFVCAQSKPLIEKNTNLDFTISDDLKEILYYASLAPNGHNTQMWKVGISQDQKVLQIYIDSSRLLPVVDPDGRESLISIGAFIENMRQALIAYGYEFSISISESANIHDNPLIAEVFIGSKKAQELNTHILNNIERRNTDKNKYQKRLLDSNSVSNIIDYTLENVYILKKNSIEFEFIKEMTLLANKIQSDSAVAREELAIWLRFSDKEAIEKADGLPAEQIGLKGIVKRLYYLTTNREKATKESFGRASYRAAEKHLNNCVAFIIITGDNTVKGYIEAGMKMESTWLKAVEENISIHPMSQALEEQEVYKQIKIEFSNYENIQMIMRAGYVKNYGENNKIRRPLHKFVNMN